MYCPNCDQVRPDRHRYCTCCGAPLLRRPQPRSGGYRAAICLIALMLVLGIAVFLLDHSGIFAPSTPGEQDVGSGPEQTMSASQICLTTCWDGLDLKGRPAERCVFQQRIFVHIADKSFHIAAQN